jgi:four helix bundle protein
MVERDLRRRTFSFACRIVALCRRLSQTPGVDRQLAGQLLRSGMSVGANLEEGSAAHSRREFACKLSLVLREARETLYWLRVIAATRLADAPELQNPTTEADELVAIFTIATRRAKQPVPARDPGAR